MTERHERDERLVRAFEAAEPFDDEVPDVIRERIWLAVSGALPPEARREVIDLTATNASYAAAWRLAAELWDASGGARQAAPGADVAGDGGNGDAHAGDRGVHWWNPRWLGAAAAVVLGTALAVSTLINRPPAAEYRDAGAARLESLVPAGAALPRNAFRLRWSGAPDGARYQVRVTTETLDPVATAGGLTAPELVVEERALAAVPAGARLLWQVDAVLPDGTHVTSATFTVRVP